MQCEGPGDQEQAAAGANSAASLACEFVTGEKTFLARVEERSDRELRLQALVKTSWILKKS
jgi:hypothetical protein